MFNRMIRSISVLGMLMAGAGLSPLADAQVISPAVSAQLEQSPRVRVMVEFDLPVLAFDGAEGPELENRIAEMDAARDAVIERALGRSAETLSRNEIRMDQPALIHEYRYSPVAAMFLSAGEIEALAADPAVVGIVEDGVSAPYLDTSIDTIGARTLQSSGMTGAGVSVAILDSGVDLQHPMFDGRIVGSACFSSSNPAAGAVGMCPNGQAVDTTSPDAGDNCEESADDPVNGAHGCFHGTHVAGIAAGGDFENPDVPGQILRGVAPGAGIVAVQVFYRLENAQVCAPGPAPCIRTADSDQVAALEWLYDNRADLNLASINMSLGGGQFRHACDNSMLAPIVRQLRNAGIATVIASGNNGYPDSIGAPACLSDAITVGSVAEATTGADAQSERLSVFSNSGYMVDMLAPGTAIMSAYPRANDTGPARAYATDGTSMATPHVAGTFALFRAAYPQLTVNQIENALESTGVVIAAPRSGFEAPSIRLGAANEQIQRLLAPGTGPFSITPIAASDATVSETSPVSTVLNFHNLFNSGLSAVSWTARADDDWLTFSDLIAADGGVDAPTGSFGGTTGGNRSSSLAVGVNANGVAPGVYRTTYSISQTGGIVTPLMAVSMDVLPTPSNDNFADAAPLTVPQLQRLFSSAASTTEAGEGNHGVAGSGSSIWYRWTAPYSGNFGFQATSESFNAVVGAYTGSSVGSLTSVTVTEREGNSAIAFDAVAGTTYYLVIAGENDSGGDGQFTLYPNAVPANDNLAGAATISGANGRVSGSLLGATREAGELDVGGEPSVWYRWTAPATGPVWFDPLAAAFPPVIVVYDGVGTVLDGKENDAASFQAVAGQDYLIRINSANATNGMFDLSWAMTGQAPARLATSILPTVRTGRTNGLTTAFATVINPAGPGVTAENCRIDPPVDFSGEWTFQATDPATNVPVGQPDTPVDLAPGAAQTFVFGLTPSVETPATTLVPVFRCDNVAMARPTQDVNTLRFMSDGYANTDIAAVAATIGNTGVVNVPLNGGTAFSVSIANVGIDGDGLQVQTLVNGFNIHDANGTPLPVSADIPVQVRICETNPSTGQCLTPASTERPRYDLDNGQVRTFSVFVRGQGIDIANAPRTNRISLFFTDADSNILGGTSVAVRAVANP